MNLYFVLDSIN